KLIPTMEIGDIWLSRSLRCQNEWLTRDLPKLCAWGCNSAGQPWEEARCRSLNPSLSRSDARQHPRSPAHGTPMSPRDITLALLVVLIWGLNFVAIAWGVAEIPPFLLTALRYIGCALPAVFFIRRPQVGWPILIAYGFSVGVLQFSFLFTAIELGMP